jgi:hypothetical protein
MIEVIGYIATFFVLISFLSKELKKLRILNSVGGTLFVIYGVLFNSWPVIITNALIVVINIYHLTNEHRKSKK